MMRGALRCCFSFLLGLVSVVAFGQDFRATVTGQVTDASGAVIPDATVKITSQANNSVKQATTNSSGNYTLPYLDPGNYTVEVTATGFQGLRQSNIVLQVAQTLNLPLSMRVGNMSEQVTVTAAPIEVDTVSADRGLVFDPVKTQQYPLNGRQEYMLLALTPGVVFTTHQFGPGGNSGTRGWDATNAYKINGGRPGTSIFLLNGAPINDNSGTWHISPNIEGVQEFKVMTNVYDAQYGRMGGGVVNTTMKSGSNAWHGDVFDYWRNSVMDANTTQNNAQGAPRGQHNQHQFGGVVGGPIRKDKDFAFFSFEGWREVVPFPTISDTVPLGLRDGQNFSQYGYNIYDPMTTRTCTGPTSLCQGSPYIRDPFPGNVIPASRISNVGQNILSYFPAPNNANPNKLNQNYTAASNQGRYEYNQPIIRVDHIFNDNDKLYGLFTFQHGTEFRNSTGFPSPAGSGDINSARTDQNYIFDWTHVISPTTVLDVRGSYGRFTTNFPRHTDFGFTADQLGIGQNFSAPTASKDTAPVIALDSYTQLFGLKNSNSFEFNTYNQYDLAPSLTMTRGNHTIHTGVEINYVAAGANSTGQDFGQLHFDQGWTQQLSGKNRGTFDGSSLASLLLGYPSGTDSYVDNNAAFYRTRPYYAVYVQDNWKISRRFTLNWGLRYDVQVPWKERFNQLNSGFDYSSVNPDSDKIIARWNELRAQYNAANPNDQFGGYPAPPAQILGGLQFAGKNGRPTRAYSTDWTNIQPRVGIAWQLAPKTVLRAGGGIYYQSPAQNTTTVGFQQRTPYVSTIDGITPSAGLNSTGRYSLYQPFPDGVAPILGSVPGLGANVGNVVTFDNYDYRVPRTYEYSFGFQHELWGGIIADVAYTGNYTIYTPTGLNQGYISYNTFQQGNANALSLDRQLPSPFFGIVPPNTSLGAAQNISAAGLLRAYPQFNGTVTSNLNQWGQYRYDALSVQIEKRLNTQSSGNFTWVLSYAFSKALQADHRLNNWNLNEPLVYEIDDQDVPQTLSLSGVWDLPLGTGKRFLNFQNKFAKALASNWKFDWIYSYNSGIPTPWPNLVLNTAVSGCSSWKAANQNGLSWFNNNKACYSNLPPYTLRTNADRFPNIRNPSQPQLNVAIEKSIPFSERYKFTFRAEAFNLANTVIYGPPDTTFSDANFGQLPKTQYNFPRVIQLAGKIYF
jgi:hypothetical protein